MEAKPRFKKWRFKKKWGVQGANTDKNQGEDVDWKVWP